MRPKVYKYVDDNVAETLLFYFFILEVLVRWETFPCLYLDKKSLPIDFI